MPVRIAALHCLGMAKNVNGQLLVALRAKPWAGRGELYRWLRLNHQQVAERLALLEPGWDAVARELGALGLTNRHGQAPSSDSVRRIWATVCRDVSREIDGLEARRARHPMARPAPRQRPVPIAPVSWPAESAPHEALGSAPSNTGSPSKRRWYDDDPTVTPETRERLRREDERIEADFARRDAKLRLG